MTPARYGVRLAVYGIDRWLNLLVFYAQLKLERTVNYGPFTQKVDDALQLRKAAFQCLHTLVDVAPQR